IVFMFEHIELGPFCSAPTGTAVLVYDPATGQVTLDSTATGCPIDAFALQSEGELFRPTRYQFPFALAIPGRSGVADLTSGQIADVDDQGLMSIDHFRLEVGIILPRQL